MKLVTDLQNFKAKVDKEIEQSNNNRGDRRILINQAVEHNLPEAFTLILPIFKGTAKQTIAVEVYVNRPTSPAHSFPRRQTTSWKKCVTVRLMPCWSASRNAARTS